MTNSSSMHSSSLPSGPEAAFFDSLSVPPYPFDHPDTSRLAAINPYFMNYDQQQLPSAFSNKVLSGQHQTAVSQFVPTNSHPEAVVSNSDTLWHLQQKANQPQQALQAGEAYEVPKSVLHVGSEKPMAREDRVARYNLYNRPVQHSVAVCSDLLMCKKANL